MCREPGLERGGVGSLTLFVEICEDGKGTGEDTNVGEGDGEHHPVDNVKGPHGDYLGRAAGVVTEMFRGCAVGLFAMACKPERSDSVFSGKIQRESEGQVCVVCASLSVIDRISGLFAVR